MEPSRYPLKFIQAGIDQLENYLLSDLIYWPVGVTAASGQPAYPSLTLGTLLLFIQQAEGLAVSPQQRTELSKLKSELDAIRTHWQAHWGRKAASEFRARIKLWRDFLEEYRRDPEGNYDRYGYEVTRRVMLHWLKQAAANLPSSETHMLDSLDRLLQAMITGSEFIWDETLKPVFPKGTYWYLYGRLPKERGDNP